MTRPFHHAIPTQKDGYRMSDAECDTLKASFAIDDQRSTVISAGSALFWQFWAHDVFNSMADGSVNLYSGTLTGDDGFYGSDTIQGFTMKDGLFKLPDDDLPVVNVAPGAQLAPDLHRANENPVLKSFHLWFARYHNKRMADHGELERAQHETLAAVTRLTVNEAMLVCDMSERDLLAVTVKDMNHAIEGNFAIARWAHAQMPETRDGGKPLFGSDLASAVDQPALWDGSTMARELNLGVSLAMTRMHHVGGEIDIRERTFGQHNTHRIGGWQDAQRKYRIDADIGQDAPIWAGMLIEAENAATGKLGPLGARMVADVIAGTVVEKYRVENPWRDAPTDSLAIIAYGWSA